MQDPQVPFWTDVLESTPVAARGRRPRPGPAFWLSLLRWVAAVLVAVLLVVLGALVVEQGGEIDELRRQAARDQQSAAAARAGDDKRMDSLESRFASLHKQNQQLFDPQAVAASSLPSVFLVVAGDVRGSAFAIGRSQAGKTNILTAFHVVERIWAADRTTVVLERGDQDYTATIVDVNQAQDLALLTVKAKLTGMSAAAKVPVSGEQILVVGAPLGLTDSITTGVVSAVRPRIDGPGRMIQFDASINPGNSGGPVINSRKEVVGIADAKARDAEGIGLAVPIQVACKSFKVC
ncbi:MAG: trypsin-like peptidase domain-containing protein [Actinoplanes sp.]